jgi:RNA-directed DNA polymerase
LLGCSDGVRPGRSPHEALEAVPVGSEKRNVNGVLAADMRGCCDARDHAGRVKVVAPRSGDRRVIRPLRQGRNAGGREEGQGRAQEDGTPHGGKVSPWAANLSRHDVLDRWAERGRRRNARGAVIIVRDGADVIVGCAPRDDAERCWGALWERFQTFTLELPPEKTRLLELGRFAAARRQRRGHGKPATGDFLGWTHIGSQTRRGKVTVRRQTSAKRLRKPLQEVKAPLRQRMHWPLPPQGAWRRSVVVGP